jgi:hypothetical protein
MVNISGGNDIKKTGYPTDLRDSGNASKVKIIKPGGKIIYRKPTYFESLPPTVISYYRLYHDLYNLTKKLKSPPALQKGDRG